MIFVLNFQKKKRKKKNVMKSIMRLTLTMDANDETMDDEMRDGRAVNDEYTLISNSVYYNNFTTIN